MSAASLYILQQPLPQRQWLLHLRDMVLDAEPRMQEKLAYGIPFYYCPKPFVYLMSRPQSVVLGFVGGHRLADPMGVLEALDRKSVRHLVVRSEHDLHRLPLAAYLQEALLCLKHGGAA